MAVLKPPVIRVRLVAPGSVVKTRKRRLTPDEIGLKADLSQFYGMKALFEALFGHPTFMRLKENGTIADWRKTSVHLLQALELAIETTVTIADQDWFEEIRDTLARGRSTIKSSPTMADLFASLSATLARVTFLQLGAVPSWTTAQKKIPLKADYWKLDRYRTVQYVQTPSQRRAVDEKRERRRAASARRKSLDGDDL